MTWKVIESRLCGNRYFHLFSLFSWLRGEIWDNDRMKHDLTGQTFGRLMAISYAGLFPVYGGKNASYWNCECSCGTKLKVSAGNLRHSGQKSCGCLRHEFLMRYNTTHGQSRSPTSNMWSHAKSRCFNPKNPKYKDYGGRGITMCDEWRNDFSAFFRDMGACPKGCSLDRRDVNGNYDPTNCRWLRMRNQGANQRKTIWVEIRGRRTCLARACRLLGISYSMSRWRMTKRGLTAREAVDFYLNKRKPVHDLVSSDHL